MTDVILLESGSEPPSGERYLIIEWKQSGAGCVIHREPWGLRYCIGPDKHAFWSVEARYLARRLKFDRLYYRGHPEPASDGSEAVADRSLRSEFGRR